MRISHDAPALFSHVPQVPGPIGKEKMIRVAALSVIAGMANALSLWNYTKGEHPRDARRGRLFAVE
jgi:hypothetical protein